jgi:hypothetical protein
MLLRVGLVLQRRTFVRWTAGCCIGGHQVVDSGILLIYAFAKLSSEEAICCTCSSLEAWLAPNDVSPAVMWLMSHILAKAAVQRVFQFGHVRSGSRGRFHLHQANVMLLHARACLVPVVIINSLEMGAPASAAKIWHFSCFLVKMARGGAELMPERAVLAVDMKGLIFLGCINLCGGYQLN